MESEQVEVVLSSYFVNIRVHLTGEELKKNYPDGYYSDMRGNEIRYDSSLPDNIKIQITGSNNKLIFGSCIAAMNLTIWLGNNGYGVIGDRSEFIATMLYILDASMTIGKDCLFSNDVCIRTSDGHHIFDLNTHKRINYARDIVIGN